jgi:hypothetical protein
VASADLLRKKRLPQLFILAHLDGDKFEYSTPLQQSLTQLDGFQSILHPSDCDITIYTQSLLEH